MTTTRDDDGIRYSDFDRVELRGRDAAAFAHAQLASDIQGLADGAWQWSAYLTPQGRTIALLLLLRGGADAIDLLVAADRGAELAARLQRFVFRSKVAARVVARGARGVAEATLASPATASEGHWGGRRVTLSPEASVHVGEDGVGQARAEDDDAVEKRWRGFLVGAGIPLLAAGAVEAFTPHALGLDALGAISTRKGCYPGQEIVARTHFLGRNKRRLFRYAATTAVLPAPGATLGAAGADAAAGTVVLSRRNGDAVEGLLVGHEQLVEASLMLAGADVRLSVVR